MAKLLSTALPHRVIKLSEQRQTGCRNSHLHHAAVARQTLPFNQAALFELIKQTGDVRSLRDESAGERERGESAWMLPTENPQGVVLLGGEAEGVSAEDAGKEFYLVPHDVTQLYGNNGALVQKGLSATELRAFSQKIKAQKQLFILDACQSSGALGTVAARGAVF